jgi:uncharacterized protein (DUF488 family)
VAEQRPRLGALIEGSGRMRARRQPAAGHNYPVPGARLFTIGYAGKALAEFLAQLVAAGVTRVVDVRALPLSRKKGFSKSALAEALAGAGIEYVHVRAAGNPFREIKDDTERCLALYAGHLDAHPEVMAEVEQAVAGCSAALLCYEAAAAECHRSVLARRMVAARARSVMDL